MYACECICSANNRHKSPNDHSMRMLNELVFILFALINDNKSPSIPIKRIVYTVTYLRKFNNNNNATNEQLFDIIN